MHNRLFILSLISLSIPHTVFTMMDFNKEENIPLQTIYRTQTQIALHKTNTKSLEEQFNDCEAEIEKKYFGDGSFLGKFTAPGDVQFDEVIAEFETHLPIILTTKELIEKFCRNHNSYFARAINGLIENSGCYNLDNVTCDTLAHIQNPNAQQPQPVQQLNKLPLVVKKYVMERAYENITHVCDITPSGHTDIITSIDLHDKANLIATASQDGTFRLWNLATIQQSHIFPEKAIRGYIKLSDDGSQLATATLIELSKTNSTIKIWDIASKKLLHTMEGFDGLQGLDLCCRKQPDETILTVFRNYCVMIYALKEEKYPTSLRSIKVSIPSPLPYTFSNPGDYRPKVENDVWRIEKRNCRSLYLCEQALKNTKTSSSLYKIIDAPAYKALTEFEKERIDLQLAKKTDELRTISK